MASLQSSQPLKLMWFWILTGEKDACGTMPLFFLWLLLYPRRRRKLIEVVGIVPQGSLQCGCRQKMKHNALADLMRIGREAKAAIRVMRMRDGGCLILQTLTVLASGGWIDHEELKVNVGLNFASAPINELKSEVLFVKWIRIWLAV